MFPMHRLIMITIDKCTNYKMKQSLMQMTSLDGLDWKHSMSNWIKEMENLSCILNIFNY